MSEVPIHNLAISLDGFAFRVFAAMRTFVKMH
jgi:hypothetical protein